MFRLRLINTLVDNETERARELMEWEWAGERHRNINEVFRLLLMLLLLCANVKWICKRLKSENFELILPMNANRFLSKYLSHHIKCVAQTTETEHFSRKIKIMFKWTVPKNLWLISRFNSICLIPFSVLFAIFPNIISTPYARLSPKILYRVNFAISKCHYCTQNALEKILNTKLRERESF